MSVDGSLSSASLEVHSVPTQSKQELDIAATTKSAEMVEHSSVSSFDRAKKLTTKKSTNKIEDNSNVATKPKRPLSAYNLFFQRERELLLEALPSRDGRKPKRSHGKINFESLAKTIAAKWKDIAPEEKEEYEKIAAVGREKYVKLAKEWKKQQRKLAKQRKREQATTCSTVKVAEQPVSKSAAGFNTEPNEHPSSTDESMMTGKVASSRFQPNYTTDSNLFPSEINLKQAPPPTTVSAYDPIPAFEDLQPGEPVPPVPRYDSNHHYSWSDPTDLGLGMNNPFAFETYNRLAESNSAMHMTAGSSVRAEQARNTYAFLLNEDQLQRREMMLRPSSSMPHMASMDSTWNNAFNQVMEPPRRLHSLPLASTQNSLNAAWDNSMGSMRMMQQSLPFGPSGNDTYDGPVNAFPPLLETSQSSSLDYYSTTEQQPQVQQHQQSQTDNFPDLQPDPLPLPFDYTVSSQQMGNFQQTSDVPSDQNEYMDLFQHM